MTDRFPRSAKADYTSPVGRIEVTVDTSEVDRTVVVFIDTPEFEDSNDHDQGPSPLRILLNDHPIYENPPYPETDNG